MKKDYALRLARLLAAAFLCCSLTAVSFGQVRQASREYYDDQAEMILPGARYVLMDNESVFPAQVKFSQGNFVPVKNFDSYLKQSFKLNESFSFLDVRTIQSTTGAITQKRQVLYKGIPIENALIIQHSRHGLVERFNGFVDKPGAVNIKPTILEEAALALACRYVGAPKYDWEVPENEAFIKKTQGDPLATLKPKGELLLVKDPKNSNYQLAWRFEVRDAKHQFDKVVFVNAHSGKVIKYYSLVEDCSYGTASTTWYGSQTVRTDYNAIFNNYQLLDNCDVTGTHTTIHTIKELLLADITDSDNSWTESGLTDFATTHFHARKTVDYFAAIHNLDSYDGSGGNLTLMHVEDWANGQYIGLGTIRIGMNSGNQGEFYNTLDVVGHEFTHGVTRESSNLTYQGESGALNESFSDILGECVEMWYENGAYTVDWLHREDYVGGANRSLINPNAGGQPDTYLGTNWANTCDGCPDEGGVHTNSGVMNYWFYLLTVGGSGTNDNGDNFTVDGIGINTTRVIAYRMNSEELGASSDFFDARAAAIAIAEDMFGICSDEVIQVTNAWYAVGVGDPFPEFGLAVEISDYAGGYNISCYGESDGSINLTATGTPPFTYVWNDGTDSQDRLALPSGYYAVTVSDGGGCGGSMGMTLYQPDELSASAAITEIISCYGYNDGEITVTAQGGVEPYSYLWDAGTGSQTGQTATGLADGTYAVTVTDANGCQAFASHEITEPPLLVIVASVTSDYNGYGVSCYGAADGTASVEITGGTPGYTIDWGDNAANQSTEEATGLAAGEYTVTVADANGCTETATITVTEPPQLTLEACDNQTVYWGYPPAECATVSHNAALGGVPPYSYLWSNGVTDESFEVCPTTSTTYTVTVTDDNGCTAVAETRVCVIDVRCGKNLDKVEICHYPPDNPANFITECVGLASVASHLAHGDLLAACGTIHECYDYTPAFMPVKTDYGLSLTVTPNPFARYATLSYSLDNDGAYSITLTDVTGRLIKVLNSGTQKTGITTTLEIDLADLQAGIYMCVLQQTDGTIATAKLVLQD